MLILCLMSDEGTMRYGQIRQSVLGITNTMLAKSLTQMEEDGLINRVQYNEMPLRVEYSLTKKANSLLPILLELKAWGEKNLR
ncbi:MAG: helix-turn-helix domain-containing protein [Bulleidia sp.]|nr:helix-turn-helix domain-containing protein [Bulleidia sp.]